MVNRFSFNVPDRGLLSFLPHLSILLLTFIAYANSFPGTFLMDDLTIVRDNPLVETVDLYKIFTSDYWGEMRNSGLYRPLTILSLGLNRLLFGHEPWSYHLVNVSLHAGVAIGLYLVVHRFKIKPSLAWLAAAIFAVHPIHTEVVNIAVGRSELLVAFFLMLGLYLSTRRQLWALSAVPVCFFAGLLSKEHAIVFLGLLPVLDWFSGCWQDGAWKKRLPLYLSLLLVAVVWLAWWSWGIERVVPRSPGDDIFVPLAFMPFEGRFLTALKLQWFYLYKQLLPFQLQGVYSGWGFMTPLTTVWSAGSLVLILTTLVAVVSVLFACWRRKLIGAVFLLYAISFAPTSNLIFATAVTMAERFAYLPSVWFCLVLAVALDFVGSRYKGNVGIPVMVLVVLSFYASLTLLRNPDFSDRTRFWTADLNRDPENILAMNFLANAQADAGQTDAAVRTSLRMLGLAPDFLEGQANYAALLAELGRFDEALYYGLRVAEDKRAVVVTNYITLARIYLGLADYPAALRWLEASAKVYKDFAVYWEIKGEIQEGLGDLSGAVDSYLRMGEIYIPADSEVPLRLGNLLLRLGRYDEAIKVLETVVNRQPGASAWNSLGVAYAQKAMPMKAYRAFSEAVSLEPDSVRYRENLQRAKR